MKGLGGAFASLACMVLLVAGIVGITAWSPWKSRVHEHELAWVEKYAAWREGIRRDLRAERRVDAVSCRARFDRRVGKAPPSLGDVTLRAKGTCSALRSPEPLAAWTRTRWRVIDGLVTAHTRDADTTYDRQFSKIAASISGRTPRVFCWAGPDWTPLAEQWDALRPDEFWVAGIATPSKHRIDLSPTVCEPLHAFYAGGFVPYMTEENLDYAESLVTLAHESEHIRQPAATEAVVECHALQRVRGMVRDAGRGPPYQAELAGLALVVGYPDLPTEYRARNCYSGGPYDLHPESKTWP